MKKIPLILLTNDDGFYANGIEILYDKMKTMGDVYIVAPDRERSATSLSLTLHHPLRVKSIESHIYAVDGTPTDCIYLAVRKLLPRKPDLVISGINRGPNLGKQDISYSGTVGGAVQGTFLQIPSMAVSHLPDEQGQYFFDFCADLVIETSKNLLIHPLPEGITLNVNIPAPPVQGIKIAKLGEKRYHPEIEIRKDPRNRDYYWIGTGNPKAIGDKDSDVWLIKQGFITVTPLHRNLTAHNLLEDAKLNALLPTVNHETA